MVNHLLFFAAALTVTLVLVPTLRRLALGLGIVDKPDRRRKLQHAPVPLLGGVAVMLGWFLGYFIARALGSTTVTSLFTPWTLLSLAVLTLGGVVDDLRNLRVRWKLSIQTLAVLPIVLTGPVIERIAVGGWTIDFSALGIPITMAWLILCSNALNLIDGMDGMASVTSLTICAILAILDLTGNNPQFAPLVLALAGATAGFLVFNLPPASIYLGDSGSMTLGLALGLFGIHAAKDSTGSASVMLLLGAMALPLADTGLAILRRSLNGRGIWLPDREHIHHRLIEQGWSVRGVLGLVIAASLIVGGVLALAEYEQVEWPAWAVGGLLVLLAIRLKLAGHHEWSLLSRIWQGSAPADTIAYTPVDLADRSFSDVWEQLIHRTQEFETDALTLSIQEATGTEREYRWANTSTLVAGDLDWSLEVRRLSNEQHYCILKARTTRNLATLRSVELVNVLDRFAEFWAEYPHLVPTNALRLYESAEDDHQRRGIATRIFRISHTYELKTGRPHESSQTRS